MTEAKELFRALEFAHYAERFRDRVFVMALPGHAMFSELLLDFKVLEGYHIQLVLVTPDPDFALEEEIRQANRRGSRFHLSLLTEMMGEGKGAALDYDRLRAMLAERRTPVIAHHLTTEARGVPGAQSNALAAQVAKALNAQKIFLTHPLTGQLRSLLPRSHTLASELQSTLDALDGDLRALEPTLRFIKTQLDEGLPDVVLVEGRAGELFQEVFTHDGAGLLFNQARTALVRPAVLKDVTDVALLLRPEIESGRILPVTEAQIESTLPDYLVYEIDGLLVGLARLKPYGQWAELSQFSTLSRYRGKGRARELALSLIETARTRGFARVFALSVDARMWDFFTALGFNPIPREELPEAWRCKYDFNRPSRAFAKVL
ncbi:MAG: GNAT family N-acetyltransferase [Deltaproteobacteria bacterium]|nr:GNAT family N-acetyltransferase [Deltaproteobacteria bacterium]